MIDLPDDMDSWSQYQYHEAVERLIAEKLQKDPNYKNTILDKIIYNEMFTEASREISAIAYKKRIEKWNRQNNSVVLVSGSKCLCDKIKGLFGGK